MARLPAKTRVQTIARTREQFLEAAATEFAREGYRGANINHISLAAGFAKGTIYNYFPSKRMLMMALIDTTAAAHATSVLKHVEMASTTEMQMGRFFQASFAFVEQHLAQAQVIVHIIYGPDNEFKRRVYRAYGPMFRVVVQDVVKRGIARGELRVLDPDFAMALIMAIYLGSCSQFDVRGKIWLDPTDVTRFVLDGLGRQNNKHKRPR